MSLKKMVEDEKTLELDIVNSSVFQSRLSENVFSFVSTRTSTCCVFYYVSCVDSTSITSVEWSLVEIFYFFILGAIRVTRGFDLILVDKFSTKFSLILLEDT